MYEYWLKQEPAKPLFPDILWSRPENRNTAGKLLIIGGNLHSFADVSASYQAAVAAGIGTAKVLLPDALRKTVGEVLENCEFAPSNNSGSFAKNALSELLASAAWADAVLLAGDFGRNSETALLLESFIAKYNGLVCLAGDSLDPFLGSPGHLLNRQNTLVAGNFSVIQKLLIGASHQNALTSNMELSRLVEILHDFNARYPAYILTHFNRKFVITAENKICASDTNNSDAHFPAAAARATVFWLQNHQKPLGAFITSVL